MKLERAVTQEEMTLYSGPGNIHSDIEVARRTGLDEPIAQGMMTLAYASELLTRIAGKDWIARGEIEVKFTRPLLAGETVTVIAEDSAGGWDVRAENQKGELLMVGTARLRKP